MTIATVNPGEVLTALLLGNETIAAQVGTRVYLREVPREIVEGWETSAQAQGIAAAQAVQKTLIIEIKNAGNISEDSAMRVEFAFHAMAESEAEARALLAVVAGEFDSEIGLGSWGGGKVWTMIQESFPESDKMEDTEFCYASSDWTALIAE